MTVAISLLVILAVVLLFTVWLASQLSEALQRLVSCVERTVSAVETVHARDMIELSALHDRLMARDLDHFKLYALAGEGPEISLEELTPEERRRERPWQAPPPTEEEESAFRKDHERRFGPLEEESDTFDPEKEGLPR